MISSFGAALLKLFKNLEAYDRKPTDQSVVQKVANAYEILGRPDDYVICCFSLNPFNRSRYHL